MHKQFVQTSKAWAEDCAKPKALSGKEHRLVVTNRSKGREYFEPNSQPAHRVDVCEYSLTVEISTLLMCNRSNMTVKQRSIGP